MQSLELNKIVGALLTAGIVASASGFIASTIFHRAPLEAPAYVVAGADEAPHEAAAVAEPEAESIAPLLAAASVDSGAGVVKKCTACHTVEKGGANKIGPYLWDVVNRTIASVDGYSYSDALGAKAGEAWSYDNLNAFLAKPKDWAPGTKMSFAGLKKIADRADLIAYLRSLSDSPAELP